MMILRKACYLLLTSVSLASAGVGAQDSTIILNGVIRDNTCIIEDGSKNFSVDLQENAAKQFHTVGAAAPLVPFRIVLSSCGSVAKAVKVSFVGSAEKDHPSVLKLDGGASAAAGIGVQILDAQKVALSLNPDSSKISWITLTPNQSNTLNFYARLMAIQVPIAAGHVNATAAFTLEYQ